MTEPLDTRRLRYFVMVAQEANFTKAARKLNMAQPPLSMQIRALEEDLQTTLFDRGHRPLRLTAAGDCLLVEARRILAELESAGLRAAKVGRGYLGSLKVAYIPPLANEKLASILQVFRQSFPSVDVHLSEMNSSVQSAALHEEKIDIGFLRPIFLNKDLRSELVFLDRMVLAVPSNHPLCRQKSVRWVDLQKEPLILVEPLTAGGLYDDLLKKCHRPSVASPEFQAVNDIHTALWLASAGFGVTPTTSSMRHVKRANLTFLDLPNDIPRVKIVMACRRNTSNPIVANFFEVARGVLAGHRAD